MVTMRIQGGVKVNVVIRCSPLLYLLLKIGVPFFDVVRQSRTTYSEVQVLANSFDGYYKLNLVFPSPEKVNEYCRLVIWCTPHETGKQDQKCRLEADASSAAISRTPPAHHYWNAHSLADGTTSRTPETALFVSSCFSVKGYHLSSCFSTILSASYGR
jgi:hypothetical protein